MKFNFFSFLIFVFIFSFFNVKDANGSFTINRPSTHNIGLVGHWTFDGADITDKVYDKSGQGNHGYFYGGATTTAKVPGKVGQALNFDGVDDAIKPTSNFPTFTTFTAAAWVKLDDLAAARGIFTSRNGSNSGFRFRVETNGLVKLCMGDTSTVDCTITTATGLIQAGKFYHIAVTGQSAVEGNIYIDGVLVKNQATTQAIGAPTSFGYIGTSWNTSSELTKGVIDDMRLYDRALSTKEVKSLYNQGASKFNKTPTNTLTNGLVGHWTFDGADITDKVYDKSGQGNHGYFYGGATTTAKVPGKIGQALNFDGVDDFVNAGAPASLNITGAMTISVWINPKTFGANSRGRIVDKQASNLGYFLTLDNSNVSNGLGFGVNVGSPIGTSYRISSANVVSLNAWQNIVSVYDGTNVTFYKDGSLATAGQTLNNPTTNSNNFIIGSRTDDNLRIFNGSIDDVRIYNRALSDKEIKMLYLMGR